MISRADLFVFLDDVKFIKREWKNRNRVRRCSTCDDVFWLTIPVNKKLQNNDLCNIHLDSLSWIESHLKVISSTYKKSPCFESSFLLLEHLYSQINLQMTLSEINIHLIVGICEYIGINASFSKSSDLKVAGKKDEKILNICESVGAKEYLANNLSMNYLPVDVFLERDINVYPQDYKHPGYQQLYDGKKLTPVTHLSIIDLIMNVPRNELLEVITSP